MQRVLHHMLWGFCIPICIVGLFVSAVQPRAESAEKENGIIAVIHDIPFLEEEKTSVLFVGDLMFDRGVAKNAGKHTFSWLLEDVDALLGNADIVVGNLEGTITDEDSVSQIDNTKLRFTFDPSIAELLKSYHFGAVSLGNNHSLDFGTGGFKETKKHLQEVGIQSFGSSLNDAPFTSKIEKGGKTFCFVGYNDTFTFDESSAIHEIESVRDTCSHTILFVHWGEEYRATPTTRQREVAHAFIDAGADLVIGAHPHVVEPVEIYKNKAIFYSLGNFVFDQYFSFATTHGLAVRVEWGKDDLTFALIPIVSDYGKVTIAEGNEKVKTRQALIGSLTPKNISESIEKNSSFEIEVAQ